MARAFLAASSLSSASDRSWSLYEVEHSSPPTVDSLLLLNGWRSGAVLVDWSEDAGMAMGPRKSRDQDWLSCGVLFGRCGKSARVIIFNSVVGFAAFSATLLVNALTAATRKALSSR